ncbi:aminotransferase class I/II-fold pyridoxal phosphate-dependent enzyme [Jatrophihabitans sp. YIM 134969]
MDPLDTGRPVTDADARPGADPEEHDLSVTVRWSEPPPWLGRRLTGRTLDLLDMAGDSPTRTALGARHGREPREVLVTAGGTEPYELVAREFRPEHAVVVHPQAGAAEAALRAHGHAVQRVVLRPPFTLDPADVPADADLVVLSNPTNPTSVVHPWETVDALIRPGRVVVVDESFAECVPGEPDSVAGRAGDGLVVVRSLPPAWDLVRLRAGYLLAAPGLTRRLAGWQSPWPVSRTSLAALALAATADVLVQSGEWAHDLAARRAALIDALGTVPGVGLTPGATAAFVLVHRPGGSALRLALRQRGFLVRKGDDYPGLGPDWFRVAVPSVEGGRRFAAALRDAVTASAR